MTKKTEAAGGGKDKGGRPAKILDETQVAQVEALAAFLTQKQIAGYLGIGESTLSKIIERQPEVSRAYKKGKSKATAVIAQNVVNQARQGNLTACFFYLKCQAGWREISGMNLTTGDDEALQPGTITLVAVDPGDVGGVET